MTTLAPVSHRVLFVCTDSLCRSPMAVALLRQKVAAQQPSAQWRIEAAATHDLNVDEYADIRANKHALRRGYELGALKARLLEADDFAQFELILAMDDSQMLTLQARCPQHFQSKLHRVTEFCVSYQVSEIPDPYFGSAQDFEYVLDLLEDACDGLLAQFATA